MQKTTSRIAARKENEMRLPQKKAARPNGSEITGRCERTAEKTHRTPEIQEKGKQRVATGGKGYRPDNRPPKYEGRGKGGIGRPRLNFYQE